MYKVYNVYMRYKDVCMLCTKEKREGKEKWK